MENTDNGTIDTTDSGTAGQETTKSLPSGETTTKTLDDGGDSGKTLEVGEDSNKTLPTHDHETKKTNESSKDNKANDKAYSEPPKEEVKPAEVFNLDYFDKPEEASPEVTDRYNDIVNGDLNYFDSWIKDAEDERKSNKEQLENYLKSNVETGNQLAYTQEDLDEAGRNLQNAKDEFRGIQVDNSFIGRRRSIVDLDQLIGDYLPDWARSVDEGITRVSQDNLTWENPVDVAAAVAKNRDIRSNAYNGATSKEGVIAKIRENHPILAANIPDNLLDSWADNIIASNQEKQIRNDLANGQTVNRGISKAEERDIMSRAASDYNSLSNAEKEVARNFVEYARSHPNDARVYQLPNPLERPNSPGNRAIAEANQRIGRNIDAVATAIENERRAAEESRTTRTETPRTPTTPTPVAPPSTPSTSTPEGYESVPGVTDSGIDDASPTDTEETTSTTSESRGDSSDSDSGIDDASDDSTTSETPADSDTTSETETEEETETPTTPESEIIQKADDAKAAYEEAKKRQYEAMRRGADETEIAQLAAEVSRLKREWDEAEAEAGPLRPREEGEEEPKKPRIGHGSENRELSREETLPEWVGGDDPHDSSAGAYWEGAFGDENWAEKLPEDTVKGLINYANDHHDNPIAMFGMTALMDSGGYDALKAGRDFQEMVAAAKQVASHTSTAIDNFKNGNIKEGIKSLLEAGKSAFVTLKEAISSAWNVCKAGLSFIVSIFAPVRSAISSFIHTKEGYNAVRDMIRDMYGIENSNEVIQEIFGDDSNTETKTAPVNVLNKTGFSVKGGTITDESSYNKGMKEKENDIVSDVCKKTMLYFPYLRKVMR